MSNDNKLLELGVGKADGGGGNCIGDDLAPMPNNPLELIGIPKAVDPAFSFLDHGVVAGAGGGGNCIGDDMMNSVV